MARLNSVLNNASLPEEYMIARVDKDNILSVLSLETTAVVTSPSKIQEKNIVIVCEDMVVAVATISSVKEYEHERYCHIWKSNNNSWRSLIRFDNLILLGDSLDNIFGPTNTIKKVQTVMRLRDNNELQSLTNTINTLYMLKINTFLFNMGIEQ